MLSQELTTLNVLSKNQILCKFMKTYYKHASPSRSDNWQNGNLLHVILNLFQELVKVPFHLIKLLFALSSFLFAIPLRLLPHRLMRKLNSTQRLFVNMIVVGVLLVFGVFIATSFLNPEQTKAAWWDQSWLYRQTVTATNSSPYSATNTPYRILIDTSTPIAAGKLKADGSDLRIINSNGSPVRFQIEQSTLNTTETGIWFDATLGSNSSSLYYIYYGNNSATTPPFTSDIASDTSSGTTVTTNDGYQYSTSTSYGRISDIKKDNVSLGVSDPYKNTGSYPGSWWDDRTFTRTELAQGPLFVEVKFSDTAYGNYSSYGTIVKMFKNGFSESQVFLNYNASGSEQLYYYLPFTNGTRNSVWVNAAGTLVDQSTNSGTLFRSDLKDGWFGQRWTDTGNYGGTILSSNTSDWYDGNTSAQASYYQTNYTTTEAYTNGSSRKVRFGTFAGTGTVAQMHEHASLLGAQATTLGTEEKSPGPAAYWKFDEGTGTVSNDSTGNGNNGSIQGSPTWKSDDSCISKKCLLFNGSSQYITVPNSSSLNPTTGLTVEAWVKPTNVASSTNYNIIAKQDWGNKLGYRFAISGYGCSTNCLFFGVGDGTNQTEYVPSGVNLNDLGNWHHVVGVFYSGTLKVYVDGKLRGSTTTPVNSISNTSSVLAIGRHSGGGEYFPGFIDEPRIYNYALSADQVKADYNLGFSSVLGAKDNSALSNGLVGYWEMDDNVSGNAQTIADTSGNTNNGTTSDGANDTGMNCTTSGKFGTGCSLDGTDDRVDVPSNTPMTFSSNGAFTIATWIKPDNLSSAWRRGISGSENYLNSGYRFGMVNGGAPTFWTTQSGGTLGLTSSQILNINAWNQVVVTYNNQTAYIYLNGKLTGTATGTFVSGANATQIGGFDYGSEKFSGVMDEYRMYNRALSPAEVSQLYNFAPGPVAYYDFEQKSGTVATDVSGNGNNATITGATWTQGKYGNGLNFDGTNDYLRANSGTILNGAAEYTFEFWLKADTQPGSFRRIMEGAGGSNPRLFFTADATTGLYGRIGGSADGWVTYPGTNNLTGNWKHIAITVDSTGSQKTYLNGTLVYTNSLTGHTSLTLTDLYIGTSSSLSYFLKGTLDDMRIYNYTRTPGQITEDMNGGHPLGGSPVGSQIGYWKFDEGSGTTADNEGNGGGALNGTINSATWSKAGKHDKALYFDGSTSNVNIPDNNALDLANAWTVGGWFNPDDTVLTGSDRQVLISKWQTSSGLLINYYLFINPSGKAEARLSNGSSSTGVISNTILSPHNWYHIFATFDGTTGDLKIYVNSKLEATTATGFSSAYVNTGPVKLGQYDFAWGGYRDEYKGFMDDVKIYSAALTADQIKLDYNNGQSLALGTLGTESDGKTPSNSSDRAYCPPGDTTATCGPVTEWTFNEGVGATANDTSGNGNSGTLNSPTWTQGKIGNALSFDGTNDYIGTSADIDYGAGNSITVTAWVKYSSCSGNAGYCYIIAKNQTIGGAPYNLGIYPTNKLAFSVNGTSVASTNTFADNKWHYAVGTLTGTTATLYVDGQLQATSAVTPTSNNEYVTIGGDDASATYRPFAGSIDQVQIYDYALSSSQVAWNFNRGKPVASYDFDECSGNTLHDLMYGNNGTITIGASGSQTSAGTCSTSSTAWGNGATGKFNSSLNFDGTDDEVNMGDQSILDFGTSDFTVSAWIKTTQTGTVYKPVVAAKGGYGQPGFRAEILTNGRMYYRISDNVSGNETSLGTKVLNDGIWHHVVWVFDRDSLVTGYVDGVVVGSNSISSYQGSIDTTSNFYLARNNGGNNFGGQLDDVEIFNYALTSQQVKNVMNQGGSVRFGPSVGTP